MELGIARMRHWWKQRWVVLVLAVPLVASLLGGAYTLHARMTAHPEMSAARYVPAEAAIFAAIDLSAVAPNHHRIGLSDLDALLGQRATFAQDTCLHWQRDVMPSAGQIAAYAAFAPPARSPTTGPSVYLIQARADTAAESMLRRALSCQQGRGHAIAQQMYRQFTIFSVIGSGGRVVASLAAGAGWLIAASDTHTMAQILDRLDGTGAVLADVPAFQAATTNLMEARFCTLYVNPRLLALIVAPAGTSEAAEMWIGRLLGEYDWGGGYLMWNTAGMRARLLFHPLRSPVRGELAGDTTGLATLAPGDALAYVGIGNLADWLAATARSASPATGAPNAARGASIGVTASPLLRQPAALVLLEAGASANPALLLRAPDAAATDAMIKQVAHAAGWTLASMTVAGQPATAITGTGSPFVASLLDEAGSSVASSASLPSSRSSPGSSPTAPHLLAVVARLANTLAVTDSVADMQTLVATADGQAPSLASVAAFQQLVAAAPTVAAVTAYFDRPGLARLAIGNANPFGALDRRATALLLSQVWNDQQLKLMLDVALPN